MPFVILIMAGSALGALGWRTLKLDGSAADAWMFRLLSGLCLCAAAAVILGSYSLRLAQTVLAITALAGLGAEYVIRKRSPRNQTAQEKTRPRSWLETACLATIAVAMFLALLSALAPVTNWDAGVAHLALPSDYARAGRIAANPGNVYSGYPHLAHTLYAVAYFQGGEKPVVLLNWTFAGLACAAAYSLGRRIAGRRCGYIAAALLASAPIFLDQAGGVSIDLAFTALATAALSALAAWFEERKPGWLVLAAWLAGSACGVRHTGYLVCALLGFAALAGSRGARIRSAAVFTGVSMLAAAPWLIRSAVVTGNPVFPFLLSWFPAPSIDHISVTGLAEHESVIKTGGVSLISFLRFPYDLLVHPDRYDGWTKSPGGIVLILGVPGLLAGGWRAWSLGAYSAAGGVCFYFFQRFARYLLPFFVPMMVVAAMLESRRPGLRKLTGAMLLVAFAYGLTLHAAAMHFKIPVLLGMQTREEYLTERVERYPAFAYANQYLNDGSTVLSVDQRTYYLDMPAYQNHWGMQRAAGLPLEQQIQWLKDRHIKYVMLPLDFIYESGALRSAIGNMTEKWRNTPEHFELVKELTLPRRGAEKMERVEVYRVLD